MLLDALMSAVGVIRPEENNFVFVVLIVFSTKSWPAVVREQLVESHIAEDLGNERKHIK